MLAGGKALPALIPLPSPPQEKLLLLEPGPMFSLARQIVNIFPKVIP
jgi:hypothetical protein